MSTLSSAAVSIATSPAEDHAVAANRARGEIATLVGGLLLILWVMPIVETPYALRYALGLGLLLFMIFCHWRDGVDPRDLGLRLDNFGTALRQLALPTAMIAVALVSFGWSMDSLREPQKFIRGFLGVPAWGFVQHFMLLAFCHRRLRILYGPGRTGIAATALLFGLIHAPNGVLMVACTLSGALWAWQFNRAPNLFATALSHGIASTCLSASLPQSILHCTRVGYRYLIH